MTTATDIIRNTKKIARDSNLVGGKAQNLARLALAGFDVPEFFVVSTEVYKKRDSIPAARLKAGLDPFFFRFHWTEKTLIAARSSSPLEDHASHSFAGLYDSYTNLCGVDQVTNAITRVWDSVEKKTVSEYSKYLHFEQDQTVAVIIQKMIQATVSGVLFTAHPVDLRRDIMLVELVEGACENLVSGKKNPVTITINKNDRSFVVEDNATLSESSAAFFQGSQGVLALLALGLKLEKLFGAPQDIEWAFDGQQIWILQSRPISTLWENPAVVSDYYGRKWSSYFFAERFMQPISPLGWSFLKPIIRKSALQDPLWYLGYDDSAKAVQLKLINGLPYANLDAYQKLYAHIPYSLISEDKRHALELTPKTQKRIKLQHIFPIVVRLLLVDCGWFPLINLWQWRQFDKRTRSIVAKDLLHLDRYSTDECLAIFQRSVELSNCFLQIHRWSITFADIFIALLKAFLIKLKLDTDISFDHLLGGFFNNATVQANCALSQLQDSDDSLNRFIQQHGHRSESLDLACQTWGEDRQRLKKMSDSLKASNTNLHERQWRNKTERLKSEAKIRESIKTQYPFVSGIVASLFNLLLYFAQQFSMLRENQRDLWHRILQLARFSVLKLARTFINAGIIETENDVFYLRRAELFRLVQQPETFANVRALIGFRKSAYKALEQKRKKPNNDVRASHSSRFTLTGIGVSAGVTKGYARVAINYNEAMQGQQGEILIVPAADPAWSPIFGVVSGLVMERGGVLSHASIVAREFRLPTITGVANATHFINNGDLIEIDGKEGRLRIISE